MEDKYPQIGLVINGPNILLSKFGISLEDILYALKDIGRIVVGKVVLNYEVSSNLLKSVIDNGLESVMVNGRVDVAVAVEGMKIIYNPRINVLALATRDAHFMPLTSKHCRQNNRASTTKTNIQPSIRQKLISILSP